MRVAADFRSIARAALRGKWGIAVIAGVIASLLGSLESGGPELKFTMESFNPEVSLEIAGRTILSSSEGFQTPFGAFLVGGALYAGILAILLAVLYFVVGSVIMTGYASFNLALVDRGESRLEVLFSYFRHWKTVAAARFLKSLYILLWSFLLIVPGIVATYSYAMTEYILAEHPELTAGEAIARSKEMMEGNRFRLFCLEFSFFGWGLLCMLTFGIGYLWLRPYERAAKAAFYREVSGTESRVEK